MIRNTFMHLPGIGAKTEQRLWAAGAEDWDALLHQPAVNLPAAKRDRLATMLAESVRQVEGCNPSFFSERLPAGEQWRLFDEFRETTAYLDIETTGLEADCAISTIAVFDGRRAVTYVHGQNLQDFMADIHRYRLLVTYNGKCFDVPVIERHFGQRLDMAHIDLRYVLASMGIKGGLKRCESQLDVPRDGLEEIDGLFAVVLWKAYLRNRDPLALETLRAYNLQDAINLEALMVAAFNRKLRRTPFYKRFHLPLPATFPNPVPAHRTTIDRYRSEAAFIRSLRLR